MIFLKKKGIKLSEYNLFTIINLAHHNHVTRVNSVWPYSILCFFCFCFCLFFFFVVVFLVFFRSFHVFEKNFNDLNVITFLGRQQFFSATCVKKKRLWSWRWNFTILRMLHFFHYYAINIPCRLFEQDSQILANVYWWDSILGQMIFINLFWWSL